MNLKQTKKKQIGITDDTKKNKEVYSNKLIGFL